MKNTKIFVILLLLSACASRHIASSPEGSGEERPSYTAILKKTREILAPTFDKKRASKNYSETDLVEYLYAHPEKMSAERSELLAAINVETKNRDLTKHLRLVPPQGQPGYSDLKFYVSHPYYIDNDLKPADNLVEVWRNFIKKAQKKIILNVFDFDLMIVADDLITLAQKGVDVRVGIDKAVVKARPEVKLVFDKLIAGGVHAVEVASVSLNHQKMVAIDWEDEDLARALFSSGNLTQSCLGPEGDLVSVNKENRPVESVPNANHVLTMKSWIASNIIAHELSKTLGPVLRLRGSEYPMSGAYQVTGPGINPQTLEAYPNPSFILTFSPGGGYRSINQNVLGHLIKKTKGPIRMVQFAFSSIPVAEALLYRANQDLQTEHRFDFAAVGDTPFAMQYWSQFLKISGLKRIENEKGQTRFVTDEDSLWVKDLSSNDLNILRENIHIAPKFYGLKKMKIGGTAYDVSAKIHHKLMSVGEYAVVGTSFNFSQGAENNNEQILVFHDPMMVKMVNGIARWLIEQSPRSVFEEGTERNKRDYVEKEEVDEQSKAEAGVK
jgi:phosphatidylserine/phosphatidylglycerophosphate/cardiolipin synthase-like enzyme